MIVMGDTGDRAGDWSRDLDRDREGEKNLRKAIVIEYGYVPSMYQYR